MNSTLITALENVAIAAASAGLGYLAANGSTLGTYGPAIAAAATLLLTGLNSWLGKPVSTALKLKCCKK
jgi:hypothetical protein